MSLAYKILGLPGTLNELFDKIEKRKENGPVYITLGMYPMWRSFGLHYYMRVEAGKSAVTIDNFFAEMPTTASELEKAKKDLTKDLCRSANEVYEKLHDYGIRSVIRTAAGDLIADNLSDIVEHTETHGTPVPA